MFGFINAQSGWIAPNGINYIGSFENKKVIIRSFNGWNVCTNVDIIENKKVDSGKLGIERLFDRTQITVTTYSFYDFTNNCNYILITDSIPSGAYVIMTNGSPSADMFVVSSVNNKVDTLILKDTIKIKTTDTIKIKVTDTLVRHIVDTINVFSNTHDTITVRDTFNLIDTVKLRDTVNAFKIDNSYYFEKLNTSLSTVSSTYNPIELWTSSDSINYSSNSSNTNTFNDKISLKIETNIEGTIEAYIYDNLGVFVDRAKFKLDNKFTPVKYLTFSGYSNTHQKVSKGVYLIRIIAEYKGRITNNIYRVGIN